MNVVLKLFTHPKNSNPEDFFIAFNLNDYHHFSYGLY